MNWQTKEIENWLDEVGVLNTQRNDVDKLQQLVESHLLVKDVGHGLWVTDYMKNLAMTEFLKHVQWEQLVYYDYVVTGDVN